MTSRGDGSEPSTLSRLVPEKRIYVRSGGRTRYFSMGGRAQIAIAALAVAGMGWSGFATYAFVTRAVDSKATEQQLASVEQAYQAKIGAMEERQVALEEELNQANERRDAATARLSQKQQDLVQASHRLSEAESELAALRLEFDELNSARREAEERVARMSDEVVSLRLQLADAQVAREELANSIDAIGEAVDRVIVERDFALARRERLTDKVTQLELEVATQEGRQERLLGQLESATKLGLDGLETMFRRAELDLDDILGELSRDYSGSGGPFEPLGAAGEKAADEADIRVAALIQDLERVNLMRFAADRLPFTHPASGGRLTSKFGPRRDPIRRRASMHTGIDVAGPRGTPVIAPAEGVITFAGTQRGYGKMIKIRHAFGFETVYAHLDRVRVTLGQRVARGDLIADMGNTGRSTGPHLHYEIRIDQEPVNPMKFIEAARDVL